MPKEINVLIGGPGTGKSTILTALQAQGHCCYPEISRQITAEFQQKGIEQLFVDNPLAFSELLLKGRIKQFNRALCEKRDKVFIDRGLPDIIAYLDFTGTPYPEYFETACLENRYSKVFILPPWEEIYKMDSERYESFEQAVTIQQHLSTTYKKFGYDPIEIGKNSIEKRVSDILKF